MSKPAAWGMLDYEGGIYDTICPDEHDREEGSYTIPLYTHPVKQLSDEDVEQLEHLLDKLNNHWADDLWIDAGHIMAVSNALEMIKEITE